MKATRPHYLEVFTVAQEELHKKRSPNPEACIQSLSALLTSLVRGLRDKSSNIDNLNEDTKDLLDYLDVRFGTSHAEEFEEISLP